MVQYTNMHICFFFGFQVFYTSLSSFVLFDMYTFLSFLRSQVYCLSVPISYYISFVIAIYNQTFFNNYFLFVHLSKRVRFFSLYSLIFCLVFTNFIRFLQTYILIY